MKAFIIVTLVLIGLVLGHDAWISYDKGLPFALSDFGWVLTEYVPSSEQYIIETMEEYNQEHYMGYIGKIMKMETIWVVSIVMGFFLILGLFAKLSESMGDLSLPRFGKKAPSRKPSLRKRDAGKRLNYKMK